MTRRFDTPRDLRVAFLGYGAIAGLHARTLGNIGCVLTVVAGPDANSAREFATTYNVARYGTQVDQAIEADDVDVVVIGSPSQVHVEQALAALDAGKHVLCEVPIAMSLVDAKRIADVVEAGSTRFMVCQTYRFWRPVIYLRNLVDNGQVTVHQVVLRTALLRRENVGWTGRRRSWTDNIVWHHASHSVDMALWLLNDDAERVQADLGHRHGATESPMDIGMTIRTRSGALATLSVSYNAMIPITDVLVITEEETFQIDDGTLRNSRGSLIECGSLEVMQMEAITVQDKTFVDNLIDGGVPGPSPKEVLPVYKILQQVNDSLTDE